MKTDLPLICFHASALNKHSEKGQIIHFSGSNKGEYPLEYLSTINCLQICYIKKIPLPLHPFLRGKCTRERP